MNSTEVAINKYFLIIQQKRGHGESFDGIKKLSVFTNNNKMVIERKKHLGCVSFDFFSRGNA